MQHINVKEKLNFIIVVTNFLYFFPVIGGVLLKINNYF